MGIIPFITSEPVEPRTKYLRMSNDISEAFSSKMRSDNTVGFILSELRMIGSIGEGVSRRSTNDITQIMNNYLRSLNGFGVQSQGRYLNALGNFSGLRSDNTIGFLTNYARNLNSFGMNSQIRSICAFGTLEGKRSLNDFSIGVFKGLRSANDLSDHGESVQNAMRLINSVCEIDSHGLRSLNVLSFGIADILRSLNEVSEYNDPARSYQRLLGSSGTETIRRLVSELPEGMHNVSRSSNDLSEFDEGMSKQFRLLGSLSNESKLRLSNDIMSGKFLPLRMSNELSEFPGYVSMRLINEVADIDRMSKKERMIVEISDYNMPRPVTRSMSYQFLIDDIDVTDKITEWSFTYDQGNVHNVFSASFINRDLFDSIDTEEGKDRSRVEIRVGSRSILFCLETKTGDQVKTQIGGRSRSALNDDLPDSENKLFFSKSAISAKEMAESVLRLDNLIWEIPDWSLPAGYEFYGTPIGCVTDIASTARAVVRCADNGDLVVRRRWPERPVWLYSSQSDISYDTTSILSDGYTREYGTGFDAIHVQGRSPELSLPELEIEEQSPVRGSTVHIRLYYSLEFLNSSQIMNHFVTAGILRYSNSVSEDRTEVVTFNSGTANVAKPVYWINEITWIGHSCGPVKWNIGNKGLRVDGNLGEFGIARVSYKTQYDRYSLSRHDIEMILAVFMVYGPDVSVIVRMNGGTKEAPALSDEKITGVPIAVEAGTAELDNTRYDRMVINCDAPYDDNAIDGVIAHFDHHDIKAVGNFVIRSVTTTSKGPQIKNQLVIEQPITGV